MAWAQFGGSGAQRSTPASNCRSLGRARAWFCLHPTASPPSPGTNVVNSSIQIGGDFQGSVQADKVPPARSLTLADAVKFGLAANLGVLTADDTARASRAERLRALSDLLPYLSDRRQRNQHADQSRGVRIQVQHSSRRRLLDPHRGGPFQYSQLLGKSEPVRL